MIDYNRLLFRRQFLLGPGKFKPTQYWNNYEIESELFLSVHVDLPVNIVKGDQFTLIGLGIIIDPFNPQKNEYEVLNDLSNNFSSIENLIQLTEKLCGRWIIILQIQNKTLLFHDACGFRTVYYTRNEQVNWCGSQPEIIDQITKLTYSTDQSLYKFIQSEIFRENESFWLGDRTIYKDCFRLLPNHYLDFPPQESIRYYPNKYYNKLDKSLDSIVSQNCTIIEGTIESLTYRDNVNLPVTAGWDSRVLLAASKKFKPKVNYYIDRIGKLNSGSADVWVSQKLSKKFDLNLKVYNSNYKIPGWFVNILSKNVADARVLPKTGLIFSKFLNNDNRININGNGSEISRNFYDKKGQYQSSLTLEELIKITGFNHENDFTVIQLKKWLSGIDKFLKEDLRCLDLFYWEHRLGNWGALFPAEQDIVTEEISPFNSRLFINNLLSTPIKMRVSPNYEVYRLMIEKMWPEVLNIKINPYPKLQKSLSEKLAIITRKLIDKIT